MTAAKGAHGGRGYELDGNLIPLARTAFERAEIPTLLESLRETVKSREEDIEQLCRVHYEDFIQSVDELRYVKSDAVDLSTKVQDHNQQIQHVGSALLKNHEALLEAQQIQKNVSAASDLLANAAEVLQLCMKVNDQIALDQPYAAIKALRRLREHCVSSPPTLRAYIEEAVPKCSAAIEQRMRAHFTDWLVSARSLCREIGENAIELATTRKQLSANLLRDQENIVMAIRKGELTSTMINLNIQDEAPNVRVLVSMTPIHKCIHIFSCLGKRGEFRKLYLENRRLQLLSDLQVPSGQDFLTNYKGYINQIAGFFLVEDEVKRNVEDLVNSTDLDSIWAEAIDTLLQMFREELVRITSPAGLLDAREYILGLCEAMLDIGLHVAPLQKAMEGISTHYEDALLRDSLRKMELSFSEDRFESLMIESEQYQNQIAKFGLLVSHALPPKIPYAVPFSAFVPRACELALEYLEQLEAFLSSDTGSEVDSSKIYHQVASGFDRLEREGVIAPLRSFLNGAATGVAQAAQVAANVAALKASMGFFTSHLQQVGQRLHLSSQTDAELTAIPQLVDLGVQAEDTVEKLVAEKIDQVVMDFVAQLDWTPEQPSNAGDGSEMVHTMIAYLNMTFIPLTTLLPTSTVAMLYKSMIEEISVNVLNSILGEIPSFNMFGILDFNSELSILEEFARTAPVQGLKESLQAQQLQVAVEQQEGDEGLTELAQRHGLTDLSSHFAQLREFVDLMIANDLERITDPKVRELEYPNLAVGTLVLILEKYEEIPTSLFGRSGSKQFPKRKVVDSVLKQLKR